MDACGRKRKRSRVVEQDMEDSLTGREQQMSALRAFLSSHLKRRKSGSLFITGPPGSGKSATVEAVLREKWLHMYNRAVINCMNIKPQQLYRHIAQKLALSYRDGEQRCQEVVKEFVEGHQDQIILVLDEVDQLTEKVLCSLFHLKIVLIGIANTLKTTSACQIISYPSYKRDEIVAILKDKFTGFERTAIEFCSRKVAAVDGDLRKAIDICRHAKDIAKGTKKQRSESESPKTLRDDPVTIQHISQAVSGVYNSCVANCVEELPLQQKATVATLVVLSYQKENHVTLEKLYETFIKVCKHNLNGKCCQSDTEFFGMCDLLESRGLVEIKKKKKQNRLSTVFLKANLCEMNEVLRKDRITSGILSCNQL